MPVPAPVCVLVILTVPVDVSVAPIVSVVPVNVTPAPLIAAVFENAPLEPASRLNVPLAVNAFDIVIPLPVSETLPVNVCVPLQFVVIAPAAPTVKLLMLLIVPICNAVLPLSNVTLFTALLAVEPATANAAAALVPVRFTVDVLLAVVFPNVTPRLDVVIAPVPLIT